MWSNREQPLGPPAGAVLLSQCRGARTRVHYVGRRFGRNSCHVTEAWTCGCGLGWYKRRAPFWRLAEDCSDLDTFWKRQVPWESFNQDAEHLLNQRS